MPTVLRARGYRLFFFSNEGDPLEPIHIHVQHGELLAKFWIEPQIEVAASYGFRSSELREIERVISDNESTIRSRWHEHFG